MKPVTYGLIVIYFILAVFVTVNILNIPYPYFNPPSKPAHFYFFMTYPPLSPTGTGGVDQNSLFVEAVVYASGQIIAQSPTTLIAFGDMGSGLAPKVANVSVSFTGLFPYPEAYSNIVVINPSIFTGVTMLPTSNISPYLGIVLRNSTGLSETNKTVTWSTEGDYWPILTINFVNESTIVLSYPQNSVHVNPYGIIQQEQATRVNIALTIALVVFGFMEGLNIIRDHEHNEPTVSSASATQPKKPQECNR